jgi:dTDP-4-dehydrorhamnose 3,5-epimerase
MGFDFSPLLIPDLILVKARIFPDDRGFFCENYKRSDFRSAGIDSDFVQDNHSRSLRGVLRGLHYQLPPHAQGKLVRVVRGKVWDVAVDVRRSSSTYGKWVGLELGEEDGSMLWIPPGFAHGFVALSETVDLSYKCTNEYFKDAEAGIRWDDPELRIGWPTRDVIVSKKDGELPAFKAARLFD